MMSVSKCDSFFQLFHNLLAWTFKHNVWLRKDSVQEWRKFVAVLKMWQLVKIKHNCVFGRDISHIIYEMLLKCTAASWCEWCIVTEKGGIAGGFGGEYGGTPSADDLVMICWSPAIHSGPNPLISYLVSTPFAAAHLIWGWGNEHSWQRWKKRKK